MAKKYLNVNGVIFQLKQRKVNEGSVWEQFNCIVNTSKWLEDCYERPSKDKKDIFEWWLHWYFDSDNIYGFGIRSYNTWMFTLQGYIMFDEDTAGIIDITQSHNYIWVDDISKF